ncbi:MAG: hypothetical protein ACOY0T_08100 [Myxococcota bacterium]
MRVALAQLQSLRASPALVVAIVAWLIAGLVLILRVPVGTGGTDEPFYSAMTYGFLLGNKPYLDELAIHQNAAILLMPLYSVYVWLHGTDGIILFNRWLYVVYAGFCSYLTYRFVAQVAGRALGCWCAALILSFTYYNLLALSYNTFGAFGFLCGVLLSALAFFERPGRNLFLASVFFGTAIFSYPTLLLAFLLHVPLLVWRLHQRLPREEFKRALIGLGLGVLGCIVAAVAFILWIAPGGLQRALEFAEGIGYARHTLLEKVENYRDALLAQRWQWLGFAALFVTLPALLASVPRSAPALAAITPLTFLALYFSGLKATLTTHPATFQTLLPLLAPACSLAARSFRERRLVLALLWLPGVVSMITIALTSANGLAVAYLGTLPTLVAGVVSLAKLSEELSYTSPREPYTTLCVYGFCAAALIAQLHNLRDLAYSEQQKVRDNDTRVSAGPFRGALTGAQQAALLVAVDEDLKRVEEPGKTLAIFDSFSVGYLATRMRPRTFTHWLVWAFEPQYIRRMMQMTYGDPATQPDFVLLVKTGIDRRHRWRRRFEKNYATIVSRPELGYAILKRVSPDPIAGVPPNAG